MLHRLALLLAAALVACTSSEAGVDAAPRSPDLDARAVEAGPDDRGPTGPDDTATRPGEDAGQDDDDAGPDDDDAATNDDAQPEDDDAGSPDAGAVPADAEPTDGGAPPDSGQADATSTFDAGVPDRCPKPPLPITPGMTVRGTLTGTSSTDYHGVYPGRPPAPPSPDVVYTYTLGRRADLIWSVPNGVFGFIRRDCDGLDPAPIADAHFIRHLGDHWATRRKAVWYDAEPGTYYFWIDQPQAAYEATLTVRDPAPLGGIIGPLTGSLPTDGRCATGLAMTNRAGGTYECVCDGPLPVWQDEFYAYRLCEDEDLTAGDGCDQRCASPIAARQDEVEPNDTPLEATIIAPPVRVRARTGAGDTDMVAVDAVAGDVLLAELRDGSLRTCWDPELSLDHTLRVLAPDGITELARNDEGALERLGSSVVFRCPSIAYPVTVAGRYYIEVPATPGPFPLLPQDDYELRVRREHPSFVSVPAGGPVIDPLLAPSVIDHDMTDLSFGVVTHRGHRLVVWTEAGPGASCVAGAPGGIDTRLSSSEDPFTFQTFRDLPEMDDVSPNNLCSRMHWDVVSPGRRSVTSVNVSFKTGSSPGPYRVYVATFPR